MDSRERDDVAATVLRIVVRASATEIGEDFPALEREELAEPGLFRLLGKIQSGEPRRHFVKFG